jgi:hypothetical protein
VLRGKKSKNTIPMTISKKLHSPMYTLRRCEAVLCSSLSILLMSLFFFLINFRANMKARIIEVLFYFALLLPSVGPACIVGMSCLDLDLIFSTLVSVSMFALP